MRELEENKLQKSYEYDTGLDAYYYDEYDGNRKIYYKEYVKWLEDLIRELEARD